ncbi:MAG: phosphoglycolate phosphatase [Candidatus Thermoplasmatota archaeon]|nr:phosphoglycolate phosphatase [Candidatus Thermoplasmatota archaeon]
MMSDDGRPVPGAVKAVVVDIDGTLTDDSRRMSLEAIAALRRVEDSGVRVMLASGNVLPIAYAVSTYMGFTGPIIAENGGIVCYRQKVWVIGDPDEPTRAFESLASRTDLERLFTDRWRETEVGLKQVDDVDSIRLALALFDVDVQTTGWAVHIMERGMDKYVGVQKACEILHLRPEQVAAIGDSENDMRMIQGCGWGIAIRNSDERTRDAADHVTKSEHGLGVVEGLEWLRLI